MVVTDSVTLDAFPRSLLLHDFGQGQDDDEQLFIPYLLVGTSTGDVITYPFVKDYELCKLEKGKCSVSFGHAPVSLRTCVIGGGAGGSKSKSNSGSKETKTAVFAAGNRASLVFWGEGRLKTSPVLLKVCYCLLSFALWMLVLMVLVRRTWRRRRALMCRGRWGRRLWWFIRRGSVLGISRRWRRCMFIVCVSFSFFRSVFLSCSLVPDGDGVREPSQDSP